MKAWRLMCIGATALLLTAAACSSGSDEEPGRSAPTAGAPAPERSGSPGQVKLTRIASLEQPLGMATRRGDPALYVIEQPGRVRALRDGRLDPRPVLDVTALTRSQGERGLLGIAFSPDGSYVYLDYTDPAGDSHVTEWAVSGDGKIDPGTRREVLFQKQPFANHNGGQLAFGPDKHLYIAFGDGGSAGDPQGNGQRLDTWLGKILRISPRPSGGRPYGVPADNPFVRRAGTKPEIWAYGLRNPWRFSFDPANGDLWIGDVGQNSWEEVDRQPGGSKGGENYGWSLREGTHKFKGVAPDGAIEPVLDYRLHQEDACSVTGGAVYRGRKLTGLTGHYIYGDYCAGWVKELPMSGARPGTPRPLLTGVEQLSSFGVDQTGELYAMSLQGPLYRLDPK